MDSKKAWGTLTYQRDPTDGGRLNDLEEYIGRVESH